MADRNETSPLLGALLRMPVDAVRHRMLEDLHAAGFTDIVPAHFAVLRYPGPDGRRPSDVAAEAGMSRQAMNYLLGELEKLGYLERHDDERDRRSRRIELTERGLAVRRVMRASVTKIEAELADSLGDEALGRFREMLLAVNGSPFVKEYRESTGQPQVFATPE
ncbi:MAG: helix-turn-helix domain-containing protein [Acidimicrobiia bacterium]